MRAFVVGFVALGLVNCSSNSGPKSDSSGPVIHLGGIDFKYDDSKVNSTQRTLINQLNAHPEKAGDYIAAATIEIHAGARSGLSAKSLADMIATLSPTLPASQVELKSEIETSLAARSAPDQLLYNREATSIDDIFLKHEMQCYSGSILFSLASLHLASTAPIFAQSLLIFRPGHVLPGYVGNDETGVAHLFGLETTVAGKGLIDFGRLDQPIHEKVIVTKMTYALLADVLRGALTDVEDLRKQIVYKTAKEFGLKLSLTALNVYAKKANETSLNVLNASVMGFGSVDVTEGDHPRIQADSLPMNSSSVFTNEVNEDCSDCRYLSAVAMPAAIDVPDWKTRREEIRAQYGPAKRGTLGIHIPDLASFVSKLKESSLDRTHSFNQTYRISADSRDSSAPSCDFSISTQDFHIGEDDILVLDPKVPNYVSAYSGRFSFKCDENVQDDLDFLTIIGSFGVEVTPPADDSQIGRRVRH